MKTKELVKMDYRAILTLLLFVIQCCCGKKLNAVLILGEGDATECTRHLIS